MQNSDLRQLDAEVAECLGWKDIGWRVKASHLPPIFSGIDPDGVLRDVPAFSSCPLACEAVKAEIRKMVATGRYECKFSYFLKPGTQIVETYVEIFDCLNGPTYCEHSESEYEAVCRAYVAAVKGGSNDTNPR